MTKKTEAETAAAPEAAAEAPINHRADAACAFVRSWLAGHAVPADAFTGADAEALIAAVDAGTGAAA